ncbi:MAG TPA: hypothetical protein VFF40_03190 [Acidimicrobiia bacterium]|nr:hypothetical protein [Acidimicrobiia bacterium]
MVDDGPEVSRALGEGPRGGIWPDQGLKIQSCLIVHAVATFMAISAWARLQSEHSRDGGLTDPAAAIAWDYDHPWDDRALAQTHTVALRAAECATLLAEIERLSPLLAPTDEWRLFASWLQEIGAGFRSSLSPPLEPLDLTFLDVSDARQSTFPADRELMRELLRSSAWVAHEILGMVWSLTGVEDPLQTRLRQLEELFLALLQTPEALLGGSASAPARHAGEEVQEIESAGKFLHACVLLLNGAVHCIVVRAIALEPADGVTGGSSFGSSALRSFEAALVSEPRSVPAALELGRLAREVLDEFEKVERAVPELVRRVEWLTFRRVVSVASSIGTSTEGRSAYMPFDLTTVRSLRPTPEERRSWRAEQYACGWVVGHLSQVLGQLMGTGDDTIGRIEALEDTAESVARSLLADEGVEVEVEQALRNIQARRVIAGRLWKAGLGADELDMP